MYSQIFNLQSDLYKALANPKRLEIVQLLRGQEMTVTEMVEMLGLPQANVSQHLMSLREQRLVQTRKQGKEVYYSLSHPNLVAASDLIRELLIDLNGIEDSLAKELRAKMKDLVPVVADPVCGMRVSPKTASYATEYADSHYYFCAAGCLERFNDNPTKYVSSAVGRNSS